MTIQKSEDIEIELNEVNSRLTELYQTREEVEAELKGLQASFIKRKTSLAQSEPVQSKLLFLNASINSLESTRNDLRFAFNLAKVREERAETVEMAKDAANRCADSYQNYLNLRQEINQFLTNTGAEMVDAISEFANLQLKVRNILGSIEPRITFAELGLPTNEMSDLVSGRAASVPNLDFGDLLMQLEHRIAQRRHAEARVAAASK